MSATTLHMAVVASRKHDSGVVANERKGMSMEIEEHYISLPATDDTNFSGLTLPRRRTIALLAQRERAEIFC